MRSLLVALLAGCSGGTASMEDLRPARDLAVADRTEPPDLAPEVDLRTPPPDLAPKPGDMKPPPFPAILHGTWFLGWSGGLDHYSWLRFEPNNVLRFLEPKGNPGFEGLWMCTGTGMWNITAKPETVQIALPMACGTQNLALTFKTFEPPSGNLFKGATLESAVDTNPQAIPLRGYKFPDAQCDANFTSCKLPL